MKALRSSGLLLHITSLPGPYGIGDFGPEAYRFVDFLVKAGQRVWQVLPLVPTGHGYSPYSSPSTFAGNPLLISPERLLENGLLRREDLADVPAFSPDHVDYERVIPYKRGLLERAYEHFEGHRHGGLHDDFERFCAQHQAWLDDYALFMALKEGNHHRSWTEWPGDLVRRQEDALASARRACARQIAMHRFWQFLFDRQWAALKAYANRHGIQILGDLPIYVAHDSSDVWAEQQVFHLQGNGHPMVVAGVPPDYFSETGQRWGNPLYRWDVMQRNEYRWWTRRLSRIFEQVDIVRLDHFRGFEAYWEIPGGEPTAINGQWVKGPGTSLFNTIQDRLGKLPIVAEDLGLITQGVKDLMAAFDFPGMVVLQFAFGGGSDYLPHNYKPNLVGYTGTHDNDTTVGWWTNSSTPEERAFARTYLDLDERREREIHWTTIRAMMASVANLVVFPLQDVLGLGSEARMNTPGQATGNWGWRYRGDMLHDEHTSRLGELAETYERTPAAEAE